MVTKIKNNTLVKIFLSMHNFLYKNQKSKRNILYKILHGFYLIAIQLIYSGYISTSAKLGQNVLFPHGFNGIFISGVAEIGESTIIFHQVTIGSTFIDKQDQGGAPIIGKNCLLGVGSKIIGNVIIGNNVKIASNVSINEDIPDNYTVVPNRPRYIKRRVV